MCPVCFSTIKTTKSLELIFPHLNSLALTVNICFIFLFFFVYFFYCRLFLWLASLGGWFEKVLSLSWWISLLRRQRKMLICTSSMTTCCFHYQRSKNNHAVLWMHSNPSQGIKHLSHYHLVHPVTLISTVLCRHLFSNQYFLPLSHFFCDFFFFFSCCLQRGKIYCNWSLSSIRAACWELSCQTSLPTEESVPVVYGTKIPAPQDWCTVRDWIVAVVSAVFTA